MNCAFGYPFYGQTTGVLVFENTAPRIPGDAGHAGSFSYPVCYEVIPGGFADLVEGSPQIKKSILDGGRRLVSRGVRAVLGDCGMMSLYQDCMGAELGVLFAGSSLCQIPMIWQLLGRQGTVGVITGHSGLLGKAHPGDGGRRTFPRDRDRRRSFPRPGADAAGRSVRRSETPREMPHPAGDCPGMQQPGFLFGGAGCGTEAAGV